MYLFILTRFQGNVYWNSRHQPAQWWLWSQARFLRSVPHYQDFESNFGHSESKFDSLPPRRFEWNSRQLLFRPNLVNNGWCSFCEIALRWMSLDLTDDKSTLVEVMASCRKLTDLLQLQWLAFYCDVIVVHPKGSCLNLRILLTRINFNPGMDKYLHHHKVRDV